MRVEQPDVVQRLVASSSASGAEPNPREVIEYGAAVDDVAEKIRRKGNVCS
jgi:hypothetical protein